MAQEGIKSPSRENLNGTNHGAANDDNASIITLDKLKKFNEIYGYEHGPAVVDEEEDKEELQDKVEEILSASKKPAVPD